MNKRQNNYLICEKCTKEFKVNNYTLLKRKIKPKYCSSSCYHESRIGIKQSVETIAKRVSKNIGKKRTQELKDKMSKMLKGKFVGKLASGYIDGRTFNRTYLRQRDKKYKLQRLAAGDVTVELIQMVYEDNIKKHGTLTCHYCKQKILLGNDQLEHKTPIYRGGKNDYDNFAVSCKRCNCRKHTKTEKEFFQFLCRKQIIGDNGRSFKRS